ncbi:hypothetical protein [Desertimonas flava]|uniref:hypothetical protein n=1 Tax=Desertimonas flava TaxID=2064846 RepID=UPI000E35362B|nr:hypothetical protein [Desertimonas flava]
MNLEGRRRRKADDQLLAVVVGTDQIDDPHIVVVADTSSGVATYFGPYPTATSALADAEALRREFRDREDCPPVTVTVAKLYAPGERMEC